MNSSNVPSTTEQNSQTTTPEKPKEFTILKTLSSGTFTKVYSARCCQTKERLVLKAVLKTESTTAESFHREMHYNYFLSPHPNIVTSYNVSYTWGSYFVYVQEFAPLGTLAHYLKRCDRNSELPVFESQIKQMAKQLVSALQFIHSVNLVHGNINPHNILVFSRELSLVKLCDFQTMRPSQSLMTKRKDCDLVLMPREICKILLYEKYHCEPSIDVWQMGILLLICLKGSVPWKTADELIDANYNKFYNWVKRRTVKIPEYLDNLTPRLLRLLRRLLEPKPSKRCEVKEVLKYVKNQWLVTASSAPSAQFEFRKFRSISQDGSGDQRSKDSSPGGEISKSTSFCRVKSFKENEGTMATRTQSAGPIRRKSERIRIQSDRSCDVDKASSCPNRNIILWPLACTEIGSGLRKNSGTATTIYFSNSKCGKSDNRD